MPSRKKYSCKFPECGNSYYWSKGEADKIVNKRFYRFPNNSDISTKWKMICGIDTNINCRNMYICEEHFRKEDFVNFTKHLLKPNVIPKHIEISDTIQTSIAFEKDPVHNNDCQPIINETFAVVSSDSNNNEVNVNMCDTSMNSGTISDETPADFYDNSMFQNVLFHNSNDSQSENILQLNVQ